MQSLKKPIKTVQPERVFTSIARVIHWTPDRELPIPVNVRPADQLCDGCCQPASDVGFLTDCRLVTKDGDASDVRYCQECVRITEAAVEQPGGKWGALGLRADLVSIEKAPEEPEEITHERGLKLLADDETFGQRVLAEARTTEQPNVANEVEWVTYAEPSMTLGEILEITRKIESLGIEVQVRSHRDERGVVDGFTLGRSVA